MNSEPEQELAARPMISRPGMRLLCALLCLLLFVIVSLLTIGRDLYDIQEHIMNLLG